MISDKTRHFFKKKLLVRIVNWNICFPPIKKQKKYSTRAIITHGLYTFYPLHPPLALCIVSTLRCQINEWGGKIASRETHRKKK